MRTFLRRLGKVFAWFFVGLFALLMIAGLALQLQPVRQFIRDKALQAAKGSVKGTIELDDVRWPTPDYLVLSGVTLKDRHGTRVASVSTVIARLRLVSLLAGEVELNRLEIADLYVDLADLGEDHGLLSLFASDEPKPPEPKKPSTGMSPIPIVIREACISHGELRVIPTEDRAIKLDKLDTCVRVRVEQSLQVAISSLLANIAQNDKRVVAFVAPDSMPEPGKGERKGDLTASLQGQIKFVSADDMAFDGTFKARGFSPSTLKALNIDTDVLRGPVDLDVHSTQTGTQIAYRALIASAAGGINADGQLLNRKHLSLHVASEGLTLSELTTIDLPTLGFSIDAKLAIADDGNQDLVVDIPYGYFDKNALPKIAAHVEHRPDGVINLRSLDAREGRAVLTGSGKQAADGTIQAKLALSVPSLGEIAVLEAAVPKIAGSLNANVTFQRNPDESLVVDSDFALAQLSAAGQRAERVTLSANLTGRPERPLVQVNLRGDNLVIADRAVQQGQLVLSGGPERYDFQIGADRDLLRIDGWAKPKGEAWDAGLEASSKLPNGVVSVQLPMLEFVPGASLEVMQMRAQFRDAHALVDGKLDLNSKSSNLRVAATVPDIDTLAKSFGANAVPGRLELIGNVRGQLEKPEADIKLRYQNGIEFAGHPADVKLRLKANAPKGQATLDLYAVSGNARIAGLLESHWPRQLPLAQALKPAKHQLDMQLHEVPLPALMDPTNPNPQRPIEGLVDGTIALQGNMSKLTLKTQLKSRVRPAREPASVDVVVDASYADAKLKLGVNAGDRQGQLLTFEANANIDVERQLTNPTPPNGLIADSHWDMEVELFERTLRDLPMANSLDLNKELARIRASFHASLGHEPHSEPAGVFESQLHWDPRRFVRVGSSSAPPPSAAGKMTRVVATTSSAGALSSTAPGGTAGQRTCSDRSRGQVTLSGKWADRKVGVELQGGTTEKDQAVRVAARAALAFDKLMAGQVKGLDDMVVAAQLHDLDLATLPWVCEQGQGKVSLTAKATDLLTPRADIQLQTDIAALQWEESPPLDVHFETRSLPKAVKVAAKLKSGDGSLQLDGQLPVDVHATGDAPMVRRKDQLQLDLKLTKLPMASVLAFVPGIARVSGESDGNLQLRGTFDAPDVRGKLALEDVSLTLPRLGQRFAHVYVKASLDGRTLRLSDGRVKDLDGSATLAALMTLQSLDRWKAEANLNARNFPLRKSGVIMGHADADTKVTADMNPERLSLDIGLKNVAINLSSDGFGDVQTLEPHPDFSFADARTPPPEIHQPPKEDVVEKPGPETNIHVKTDDPLWVRRDDFAVMMTTDMFVILTEKNPILKGKIQLIRGYISLLGQSFDIKRGQVVLSGGETVDPQLELTAEHDTPGGKRVRVEVKGFVTKPELAFFVNDQPVTAGDAIIAITGRNERSGGAAAPEQQVASAAIGMTTGLLTLGARREFGDWIPMLAFEQGDQTRVRVGVEADRFVPKFMKGFVRGAYVEGIVATQNTQSTSSGGGAASGTSQMAQGGASSSSGSSTASGTGVLLELTLPKSFVFAAQYGPGTAWSMDLDWRP